MKVTRRAILSAFPAIAAAFGLKAHGLRIGGDEPPKDEDHKAMHEKIVAAVDFYRNSQGLKSTFRGADFGLECVVCGALYVGNYCGEENHAWIGEKTMWIETYVQKKAPWIAGDMVKVRNTEFPFVAQKGPPYSDPSVDSIVDAAREKVAHERYRRT